MTSRFAIFAFIMSTMARPVALEACAADDQLERSGKTVYVAVQRATLQSGPSEEYYPTGMLSRGTSLSVYHTTDDGWLAVRPPPGSFSWVAAPDAYLLPGGREIEIVSDSAVSWIGSELGSARQYRWQVQLNKGEQLAVVGEKAIVDDAGKETLWYQIAPPAGEFRWLRAEAVSDSFIEPSGNANMASEPRAASDQAVASDGDSAVTTAAASDKQPAPPNVDAATAAPVVAASYVQDEVFGSSPSATSIVEQAPSQTLAGGAIGDEYYGNEYDAGEVYYEDSPTAAVANDPFAGWHAMELTENGLQMTLLQRLFGRRPSGPDPLAMDPFDISLAGGEKVSASPVAGPTVRADSNGGPLPRRATGGWRDPRTLRSRSQLDRGPLPLAAPDVSFNEPSTAERLDQELQPAKPLIARLASRLASTSSAGDANESATHAEFQQIAASSVNTPAVEWYGVGQRIANTVPEMHQQTSLDLTQIQVTLSETVTQPMQLWNLQPLYDRAQYYVEHGSSAVERGQARLLIERIEEFAELARKSGFVALQLPAGSGVTTAASLGGRSGVVVQSDFQRSLGGEQAYDATGWLVPVLAARKGQPSHALTDETGNVLTYVSGLPGMNLDRYLNQAVGLIGLRGYLPQLQAGHIQAQRVMRLQ